MQDELHERYLDYRLWLRTEIAARRRNKKSVTLEQISKAIGGMTKGHLSLILSGKRNLNEEKAVPLARAIGFRGDDIAYFERLVRFNQAKDGPAKEHYLRELVGAKRRKGGKDAPLRDARVLERWHALVILELLRIYPQLAEPRMIALRLRGLLSSLEVKRALQLLEEMKALERTPQGFSAGALVWRSTDEVSSAAVRAYHRSCLELSSRVLDTVPVEQREFGSVNIGLSTEGIRKAKDRLKAFREEILAIAAADKNASAVCQFNFQFFALNETPKGMN